MSDAQGQVEFFDKPHRIGADAVFIGDDKSITDVRLHGAAPDGMQPGSVSHHSSQQQQPQRSL